MGIIKCGGMYKSTSGETVTVIEQIEPNRVRVKFNDAHGYEYIVYVNDLLRGHLRNPYSISAYGYGYFGDGPYLSSINGTATPEYTVWYSMLERCYNPARRTTNAAYVNSTVCPEWHNFQNFAHWYCDTGYYAIGYELDKDLLYPGNNLYSPDTCCMIPSKINTIIRMAPTSRELPQGVYRSRGRFVAQLKCRPEGRHIGVYPTSEEAGLAYNLAKKTYIRNLANEWAPYIDINVYEALLEYAEYWSTAKDITRLLSLMDSV